MFRALLLIPVLCWGTRRELLWMLLKLYQTMILAMGILYLLKAKVVILINNFYKSIVVSIIIETFYKSTIRKPKWNFPIYQLVDFSYWCIIGGICRFCCSDLSSCTKRTNSYSGNICLIFSLIHVLIWTWTETILVCNLSKLQSTVLCMWYISYKSTNVAKMILVIIQFSFLI